MKFEMTIKMLDDREKQLSAELDAIKKEIADLKDLSTSISPKNTIPSGNRTITSYKGKVYSIIKNSNRFCTNREIVDMYIDQESLVINDKQKKKFIEKTTNALSNLKRDKKLVNHVVNKNLKNTVWGLNQWLDEKDNIKPDHKYNEDYIQLDMF